LIVKGCEKKYGVLLNSKRSLERYTYFPAPESWSSSAIEMNIIPVIPER